MKNILQGHPKMNIRLKKIKKIEKAAFEYMIKLKIGLSTIEKSNL